jgi:hypothetical protein
MILCCYILIADLDHCSKAVEGAVLYLLCCYCGTWVLYPKKNKTKERKEKTKRRQNETTKGASGPHKLKKGFVVGFFNSVDLCRGEKGFTSFRRLNDMNYKYLVACSTSKRPGSIITCELLKSGVFWGTCCWSGALFFELTGSDVIICIVTSATLLMSKPGYCVWYTQKAGYTVRNILVSGPSIVPVQDKKAGKMHINLVMMITSLNLAVIV